MFVFWLKHKLQIELSKLDYQLTRNLPENEVKAQILNNILLSSKGVLHIGAHFAEEAEEYSNALKPVLWIEADPKIFQTLNSRVSKFHRQQAKCALLGDANVSQVKFYRASNEGASSSIFNLAQNHGFSNLKVEQELTLPMVRLDSILSTSDIETLDYWVIDVQGAELNVLRGAGGLINLANFILVEASNREIYNGGVKFSDLNNFLVENSFVRLWDLGFKEHSNLIYVRRFSNYTSNRV
jgi:FkbM family methyltransferase